MKINAYGIGVVLLSAVYLAPLSLSMGQFSGFPIDLAISNAALFVFLFYVLCSGRISKISALLVLFSVFFLVIGMLSASHNHGSLMIIFSAFSFSIPFFHLVVGAGVVNSKFAEHFSLISFSKVFLVIILSLFVGDLVWGSFPFGCGYEGRWGGCLGPFLVYGFPNASMNALAIGILLLGVLGVDTTSRIVRLLVVIGVLGVMILAFLSLSRSSLLVSFIAVLFAGFSVLGVRFLFVILFFLFGISFFVEDFFVLISETGQARRIIAALEGGDITTGRISIWRDSFDLFSYRPFFGYAFVSFSRFSDFGTVHQQYLEVLFKTGIVGFFVYLLPFYFAIVSSLKLIYFTSVGRKRMAKIWLLFGAIFAIAIANLFQPLISYQVFGNVIFFLCGYAIAKARLMSSSDNRSSTNETNPPEPLHRSV